MRYKRLIDHLLPKMPSWADRLDLFSTRDLASLQAECRGDISLSQSIPPPLFALLRETFGPHQLREQCRLINTPAPIALRANLLKTSRDKLISQLPVQFQARPSHFAPAGVIIQSRAALFSLPQFQRGWFEVQDEGSQLIAEKLPVKPGDWVIDYCAGSGGKSLALAPRLLGKGQLFLGDVRARALQEAKLRLRRAGIQNAQFLLPDHATWRNLRARADCVLVDAPCTGSGTLRRSPDLRDKIDGATTERMIDLQREIFEQALRYVKPGKFICYATCSLLKGENHDQVAFFTKHHPIELYRDPFQTQLTEGGPDGFFAAVFQKRSAS